MKLIVGLGNPGPGYTRTRHNVGFMVADQLAAKLETTFKDQLKLKSEVALAEITGERLILAKPQTYMNLSGEAVQRIMQFYKLAPQDIWVIFDDVDVPFGRLRLRIGGTSGHQGITSIIKTIGSGFVRARIGISLNDRRSESSEQYVLKPFNSQEQSVLDQLITNAAATLARQVSSGSPAETTFDLLS